MTFLRIIPLVLLSALLTPPATARSRPVPIAEAVDRYVRSFADSGLFSGVVLVQDHGRTIYEKAYGVADRAFGVPLDTHTKFQIASVSKPITAAAVARLVDQGKLSFDDPIGKYIPGIPNGDRITVDQLLTHYSGLDSPDRQTGSESWMRFPSTPDQLVERVKALPPAAQPGEKYFYSNGNYWILAKLIEQLSGMPYGLFLQREIFGPLGMKDSGHRGELLQVIPHLADGYAPEGLRGYRLADLVDWTSKTGNGSIYSTVDDLAKFYDALIANRLLKPATTARVFGWDRPGYAWFHRKGDSANHRTIWYNGRSPGYTAHIEGLVDDGKAFIILSNLYVYAPTIMAKGIAAILKGQPYALQQPIRVVPAKPGELEALAGNYRFGPSFFIRNGVAQIIARDDHLIMRWPSGGLVSTLLPTGPNSFFDPTFWATIRFEKEGDGMAIKYRVPDFDEDYRAVREAPAR